jgi:hypothetical protein
MRSFLFSLVFLLLASEAAVCQLQTIQTTDIISNAPGILNYNFSYLNTNKPQIFTGSGAPGSIPNSIQGSLYLDTANSNVWQCFSAKCSSSPHWVQVNLPSYTFNAPLSVSGSSVSLATPLATAYGGTGTASVTGSGSLVLSNSPVLTTPNLGIPSYLNCASCFNIPLSYGSVTGILSTLNGGTGVNAPSLVAGPNIGIMGTWPNQTVSFYPGTSVVTSIIGGPGITVSGSAPSPQVQVSFPIGPTQGGTGVTTLPSLLSGTCISVTGTWPNQTITGTCGGGSLPGTTQGDTFYYTGTATARLAGPTVPGTWLFSESPVTSGTPVAPAYVAAQTIPLCSAFPAGTSGYCLTAAGATALYQRVDSQTGSSYTVPGSDAFGLLTLNNTSAVSVALPQAGLGTNFPAGSWLWVTNYGTGAVTLTASTSLIGPSTNVRVIAGATGSGSTLTTHSLLLVSDGSNFQIGMFN